MKTHSFIKQNVIQYLNRFTKFLCLAGMAAVLVIPQVEARPGRHGGGDRGGHSSRHHGGRHYRPAPVVVRRGWARPGFYGAYPPSGYVDYRYIRSLPRCYRTVYHSGHRYYYANGNYYWPARYHNNGIYISVRF